jgi:uncharacterized Zn finger protein
MNDLQAPWVGDPFYEDEEPHYCPICGEEAEEFFASKFDGKIVGCENCVGTVEAWELEDE